MNDNISNQFNESIMHAVARRIARLAQTNPAKAQDDFEQHASAMTVDEREDFEKAIVGAAIELTA